MIFYFLSVIGDQSKNRGSSVSGSAQLEEVIAAFTQSSSAGAKTRSEL